MSRSCRAIQDFNKDRDRKAEFSKGIFINNVNSQVTPIRCLSQFFLGQKDEKVIKANKAVVPKLWISTHGWDTIQFFVGPEAAEQSLH